MKKIKLSKETLVKLDVSGVAGAETSNCYSEEYSCRVTCNSCPGGGSQPAGSGVVCGTGYSCYLH